MHGIRSGLALACVAAACSADPNGAPAPEDAAAAPEDAAATAGDIHLDLRGGLQIYDHPGALYGPGGVSGLIDVFRTVGNSSELIPGATLTLNGVSLPKTARGEFTTVMATGLKIGPGTQVDLVAMAGASRLAYTFDCPDVVVTAPADGDTVVLGEPLVISWTGTVRSYARSIDTASVAIYNYDSTTGIFSGVTSYNASQVLDGSTQTATLPIPPAVDAGFDGLAVMLIAPGEPAADENQLAVEPYCTLNRRVILKVSP